MVELPREAAAREHRRQENTATPSNSNTPGGQMQTRESSPLAV
jgi:hypothetical protein